ncbi:ROK family protein [Paracoccus sp. JM45]|uniref:ROK family protein n=1 Tax=Paracoccus sp. JM45 TaxID=2283626 RepID=UPI000E6C86C5|nr:ROK family protein [Paracoccus sp. JM45]RJE78917.1 ROK family protein [Paracoccus sp. JM45]
MILCFDIGGTTIKAAQATSVTDVTLIARIPTPIYDFTAFVGVLADIVAQAPVPPQALAFSIAGVVDPDTGRATMANIPCLTGRNLKDDLQQVLGLPVVLANDADCFALAESATGAGQGHHVVFGLILGTGVGGGIVVRGSLINSGGFAGEIGHGPVAQRVIDQPQITLPAFACGCGQTGCLDAVCSARGIERLHRHLHGDRPCDSRDIVAAWERGDVDATTTIDVWLALLAGPLAMVQNVLGAGIIAAGGGLSTSAPLINALDAAVRDRCLRRFDRPLVVPARCTVEPGLIGAALLGLRHITALFGTELRK